MKNTGTFFLLLSLIPMLALSTGDELPVATDNFSQNTPMVVYDGEDYFTIYIDRRGTQYSFYSRFISPDGNVGPEILVVEEHPVMSFMPGLAKGDDNFLFTWSRQRDIWDWDRDGMARIINADGSPASGTIQVSGPETQDSPAFMRVAYGGDHYLVIWQDGLPNQGARIMGQFVCSTDYNLVGSNFLIRPDDLDTGVSQIYPDILFDGTRYLVVWDDDRTGERSVYGMFLDTDGHADEEDFAIADETYRQMLVRVAYNGQHYMAVWADRRHGSKNSVYGQLFDHNGELVGDEISLSILENNEGRSYPRVASNGNQFMVAWEQQNLTKEAGEQKALQTERDLAAGVDTEKSVIWYEVHGRLINADGSYYSDEMPIGVAEYHQQNPEIAGHDDQFLVLWQDSRVNNQYSDVYGRFMEGEPPQELPEPVNLTAEFTGEAIELQWEEQGADAKLNLLGYNLYKDGELLTEDIDDTWYTDTAFEQDTTYEYHVTAVYDAGESEPSNTAIAEVPVLFVNVTFGVTLPEGMGGSPIEGALVWLEGHGEMHTDEYGMAHFNDVGANGEFAWEVSHEHYFTETGTALTEEEDLFIEVVLTVDDTSLNNLTGKAIVSLSPNPVDDLLRVKSESTISSIQIYDTMGSLLLSQHAGNSTNINVPVERLVAGMYVVQIKLESGQVITKRLIRK